MNSSLKKVLAVLMSVLLLISIVPVAEFVGFELPDENILTVDSSAAYNGLSSYSATAAVQWAKDHWNDIDSVLFGQSYWDTGGDCANFVSQCIYMGGLDMTEKWHINGYLAHYYSATSDGEYIRAQQLHDYCVSLGATSVRNPSASQVSVGDLMFYSAAGSSRMTHSAIVVDIVNGVPIIAAHSVRDGSGNPIRYITTSSQDWHLGFEPSRTYLVKMYGDLCSAENPRSIDVYTAGNGDTRLYNSTSTSSGYETYLRAGEYAHIYKTVYANGYNWGYTCRYGFWGWVKLSSLNYQRHVDSYVPSHTFGNWYVKIPATCTSLGTEQKDCTRCGYAEYRTTGTGGHVVTTHATCTSAGFCDLCGASVEAALGHDPAGFKTIKEATCTAMGLQSQLCKRCGKVLSMQNLPKLGHNYVQTITSPSCVQNGTMVSECTNCGHSKVDYVNDSNTWSDWTTEYRSDIPSSHIESKTQYRYRDKDTITSSSSSLSGWTPYDTVQSGWGSWSSWQNSSVSSSSSRQVETRYIEPTYKTVYVYFHYCNSRGTYWANCVYDQATIYHETTFDSRLTNASSNTVGSGTYYTASSGCPNGCTKWYVGTDYTGANATRTVQATPGYTQYRYRDATYTYYFYQWGNWSSWSDSYVSSSDSREVQTRTMYRYDLAAYGHDFSIEDPVTKVEATCTIPGYVGKSCSRCGAASPESSVIPALGHNMGGWYYVGTTGENPSYNVERRDCQRSNCDYYELRVNGNIYYYDKTVEPTCENQGYSSYYGNGTGELRFYYTDALGHESDEEWITVEGATCEKAGLEQSLCVRHDNGFTCSRVFEREIPALPHTEEIIPSVEATCTEDGATQGSKCSVCHNYIVEPTVIPATGHKTVDENGTENWTVISEVGCDVIGVKHLYCIECGVLVDEEITPALVPEYIKKIEKLPDCVESGYIVWTCKNCVNTPDEHGYTEFLGKEGHRWSDWTDTTVSTEDVCVISTRECTVCGEYEEVTKYDTHEFTEVEIEGECVDGVKHVCDNCGYEMIVSDADSHDMSGWTVVKNATCEENGLEKRECSRGDYVETRIIPALGHNYKVKSFIFAATCTEWGYENMVCENDSSHTYKKYVMEPLDHSFNEKTVDDNHLCTPADCLEAATYFYDCSRCDTMGLNTYVHGEALGHDWDNGVIDPEATCVEDGVITYTCLRDSSHKKTEAVTGGGHDMGEWFTVTEASCTKEGLERRECQRDACEYFEERSTAVDKNAHTEDDSYTVTKKASCTEYGEKVKKCTECGEVLVLDVISKREHIYDEGVVTSVPSCVSEGEITYTCTNIENNEYEACTHSYTEAIKADGHDMGSWYIEKEAEYHVPGVERRDCRTENCDYYETREYEIAVPVYVATFVIGDEIISKVEFEHGATFIKEPAIPEKTNYIGIWEDYEIVNENFTVEGYYELIDSDTVSTLQEDKKAQYKNDVAQITLSAFAPTKIVEYASPNAEPLDIVLVLDQSGSMAQRLNGSTTKKDALKKSANAFLNEVLKNGETAGVEHRVAVVGFAYGANYSYNNTELLSYVSNGRISPVKYNTIKKNASSMEKYYSNAFLPISDGNGINDLLTSAISNVDAEGATAADFGLEMASKIFDYNYTDPSEGRKKIVLFITDGEPNYHSGFDTAVANAAIGEAFAIKQSGCNIYSVGISADADPDIFDNSNKSFNRFLHLVSSNYRNASTMISSGMGDKNNGFYLAVNNTDNLGKLFEVIVSRAVNKTVAFDNVTLVDTISSEFTLTSQQEDKLREELFNTHGLTDENLEVTRNDDGTTTMKFIGLKPEKVFENGVNTGFKVSVTFEVTPNEKALNKGIYKTNTSDAGVELGGDRVAVFAIPEISIPDNRNIVTFKIGNEVYSIVNGKIGDSVTAPECEYAEWNVPEGTVISDRAFTFTADGVADDKYAVTWVINGESYVEYYTIGSKLNPPAVKAEEGFMFVGFAPYVPSRMPSRNIVLTAKFEEHEHKYEETLSGGTCDTGLTMRYSCFCGSVYTETLAAQAHKYSATVINSEEKLEDAFVCEYCQKMLDATLSFCYSGGTDNSEFYSLEMKKGEINVQPDGTVTVKIPLTAEMAQEVNNGRGIKVYRIEGGNTKTFVDSYIQDDAFVVMTLDHFSYYVLGLTGSDGNLLEDVNFATVKCSVDGHSYTKNVIPPDCTNRGYTIYTCGTCGYSYEGDFIGMTDHKDSDGDLYCDDCGKDISAVQNCGHLCHKDGFLGFIWKIVRFFIKLFGTNPVCSCGRAHY